MKNSENDLIIAIDGPAASGKSTVALRLSRRLGITLVDSGSMYRAVTLLVLEEGIGLEQEGEIVRVSREVREEYRLTTSPDGPTGIYLGNREITKDIRSAQVGEYVSPVSAIVAVRREMVQLQREIATGTPSVVEGRDIGTTVFPGAQLKIFLDADREERVHRRFKELIDKGIDVDLGAVRDQIEMRDRIDSSRESSPLALARDAEVIDTTHSSIDEVVSKIESICEERGLTPSNAKKGSGPPAKDPREKVSDPRDRDDPRD